MAELFGKKYTNRTRFTRMCIGEAVFSLMRGRPLEEAAMETLKTYYQERLTFRDGRYWRVIREPWALISWLKKD